MSTELGMRERKKQRTRDLIRETAVRLFLKRGFDQVTVVEIAREADVSEATVFNHFPTKEDLVYGRMEAFEQDLLDAVRTRAPGQSALSAYADFVFSIRGLMAEQTGDEQIARWARLVLESPALVNREHQVFAHHTVALAELLAEETDADADDAKPWIAANMLIGLHRALLDCVRRQALAGLRNPALAHAVRRQGEQALALLNQGFSDYAVKPGRPRTQPPGNKPAERRGSDPARRTDRRA